MKRVIFVFLMIFLTIGCFTPVGKIPESDFAWEEKTINSNYQEVYRNILNGFRTCKMGIAEGNLYTDIKEGYFDVYLVGTFGGKHPGVLGVIRLKSTDFEKTTVRVGVQHFFDGRGTYRKTWLRYAEGNVSCE